ncbi:LysR family transcriptional regulator [Luteimonas sp. RIT-PG2_3]
MHWSLPPLNALRAFEACARLESVSRSAEELHVTHSAVSRQIRLLEEHFGLALFVREGRGLRLTPAGQRLRDATGGAFSQIDEVARELRRGNARQTLVLGCPGSLLARWMIPRLEPLAQALPTLTLHLSAQEGGFDPQLSGVDAALMIAAPPWPASWQVHTLGVERIGPVLSPQHPAADVLRNQPAEALLGMPLLHTLSRPQAWREWSDALGLPAGGLRTGTGFEHLYYLLEAAVSGLGVAIAPQQLVEGDIASGRLLAPWGFVDTPGQWMLCTRATNPHPQAQALADWLRQALRQADQTTTSDQGRVVTGVVMGVP